MSTVKGKNKLCSTPASGISVENIGGIPFYDRYVEFDHLLQKYVTDRRYKDSFAEPLFNGGTGTVDWYVPTQYTSSPRLEDIKGTADYDDAVRQRDALIQYLKRQMLDMPDHDRQYFDCLIKYANSNICDYTTFYRNGHVILGVWGLHLNGMKDISMAIRTDIDDRRVYTVTYQMDGDGVFTGVESVIKRKHGHVLNGARDIPNVVPGEGFEFSSWEPDAPHNKVVESDMTFTAVCTLLPEGNNIQEVEPVVTPQVEEPINNVPTYSNVVFNPNDHGKLKGISSVQAQNGVPIDQGIVPRVKPFSGYEFVGWDKDTSSPITEDTVFKAQYKKKERRFLGAGNGAGQEGGFWYRWNGCVNWIIGILLFLLLLFLLSLLLRSCGQDGLWHRRTITPVKTVTEEVIPSERNSRPDRVNESSSHQDDPSEGNYDGHKGLNNNKNATSPNSNDLPIDEKSSMNGNNNSKVDDVDYEEIRALIREYQQRIDELIKMLPENNSK